MFDTVVEEDNDSDDIDDDRPCLTVMHLWDPFSAGRMGRTRTATWTEEDDEEEDDGGEEGVIVVVAVEDEEDNVGSIAVLLLWLLL